jgi:uncharacterized SAM-binding protein YcdF (DUF218 family)
MFFFLSKTVGFLAYPSNAFVLLGLFGLVLLATRLRRAGAWLMASSIVLLAIGGWSPLGNALILPLEQRFPQWDATRGAPDGIIVLGGAIIPRESASRNEPQVNEAAERMLAFATLARRYPDARLVYSGGSGSLIDNEAKEADYAVKLMEQLGIPRARMEIERLSRNTAENATLTKALVQPKPGERWLLVTSAAHMPRSMGIFRKVGFPVEAYPVDWRTGGEGDALRPFDRISRGLPRLDVATREWVGLIVYWLAGKTSELFPGPERPPSATPAAASPADRRP